MRKNEGIGNRSTRICRLLLMLCPRTFRREVGREIEETHLYRLDEIRGTGFRTRICFMMNETMDLVRTAVREWKVQLSQKMDPVTGVEGKQ